nr:ribonuclease H-like domain-containing protein [Tanacetum cinerariifolium]
MIKNHSKDRLVKEVLLMLLVMHTEEDDTVLHIVMTGMWMLVVEVDVGSMTANVVDKLTCASDDVQPKQVDLRYFAKGVDGDTVVLMNVSTGVQESKTKMPVLGLKSHVETDTASTNPEWCQLDDLIMMWILRFLCDSLQEQVITTPGNTKALWVHLKNIFYDNKDARAINLDNELRSIKIEKMTVNEYCTKIQAMENRLNNLDCEVSEKNMLIFVVNGLDSRFATLAKSIHHREPLPTFEMVRNMLLLKESSFNDDSTSTTFEISSFSPSILMASSSSNTKGNTNTQSKSQNLTHLCNHFSRGTCKFGDQCKFIHDHQNMTGLNAINNTQCAIVSGQTIRVLALALHQIAKPIPVPPLGINVSVTPGMKGFVLLLLIVLFLEIRRSLHMFAMLVSLSDLWTTPIAPHACLQRFTGYATQAVLLQQIVDSLYKEFDMTDLGVLNYFLGISAVCHPTLLFLSQKEYALQLLERSYFIPQSCRGLQYLTFIRPDLSYAVQQICLYMHDPREPHFAALKRILCYVQGTLKLGLYLYASATTSGDNLLSWSAKQQHIISRSRAEAEYRDVADVVAETTWLRNLLRELHSPLLTATLVYCDNVSAVYISANPVQHQQTKHIHIDIHFVHDMVKAGHVRVLHVPSRFQYANIFTKGLPSALFEDIRSGLSVRPPPA